MRKIFYIAYAFSFLLACNKEKEQGNQQAKAEFITEYKFENGTDEPLEVKVTKSPQRAAMFSQFMTEMGLALGLEDRMVLGTVEGEILPQFSAAYQKVPNKIIGHHFLMTKEAFLLLKPDFVSGFDDAIKPEMTGSAQELLDSGIYPYTVKSIRDGATLDVVYEDFLELGRIFDVQKKADEVVSGMKTKLSEAAKNFKNKEGQKPKVLVFSAVENGVYVSGGLTTDLINRANGENVYKELKNDHELVSFESLAHKDPDVIFVAHMAQGMTVEEKMNFLRNHPALKELSAVKNNKMYKIALEDISPGVRNVDFIIKMNKAIYE